MSKELKKLIIYLKDSGNPSFNKIAKLADIYKNAGKDLEEDISNQKLLINLHELESLVNPERFDIKPTDLGTLTIDN
jgi:hypothetical protein